MDNLKECPFCGGTDIISRDHAITFDLECTRCGCRGPIAENAYKAWNHRPTEDKLREALEEIKDYAKGQEAGATGRYNRGRFAAIAFKAKQALAGEEK